MNELNPGLIAAGQSLVTLLEKARIPCSRISTAGSPA